MNQLTQLARPFPSKYIKKPAPGKYGTYVDHEIVTQALLFIVGPFSFKVEQLVYNPDGILDGCTASLTCVVDGREVTITEAGDCENPTNSKTQGDRLKKAASDALKRCAMRLGCGIHLWAGTEGDFFLYDSLSKEDLHANENAEVGTGSTAGSVPAAEGSTPSPVSAALFQSLKARAISINDADRVNAMREKWNLPLLAQCDEKQLALYGEMLREIETELEAPFTATAPTGETVEVG